MSWVCLVCLMRVTPAEYLVSGAVVEEVTGAGGCLSVGFSPAKQF